MRHHRGGGPLTVRSGLIAQAEPAVRTALPTDLSGPTAPTGPGGGVPRQPRRPVPSAGRPSGPPRRGLDPVVRRSTSSASRCLSGPAGHGRHEPPSRLWCPRPKPAAGCVPSRVSLVNSLRLSGTVPHSRVGVVSTTINRSRTPSKRPATATAIRMAARLTTRSRGCVTAAPRTKTSAGSTGAGRAHQRAAGTTPGSTTAERAQARGGRISRGSANTNVSLAVVTGWTVSKP